MIGFYSFQKYNKKLQEYVDRGYPRDEARYFVDKEEEHEYWESQRLLEEDNQYWFEDQDGHEAR